MFTSAAGSVTLSDWESPMGRSLRASTDNDASGRVGFLPGVFMVVINIPRYLGVILFLMFFFRDGIFFRKYPNFIRQ